METYKQRNQEAGDAIELQITLKTIQYITDMYNCICNLIALSNHSENQSHQNHYNTQTRP